jgi:hypothetical protein
VDEAKTNRVWFYVSIVYLVVALASTFIPAIPDKLFRLAALALLLGWYFSLGKKQVLHVKETWPDGYVRKPWKKPLLIALGRLIGAFVLLFSLAMVQELVFGSQ